MFVSRFHRSCQNWPGCDRTVMSVLTGSLLVIAIGLDCSVTGHVSIDQGLIERSCQYWPGDYSPISCYWIWLYLPCRHIVCNPFHCSSCPIHLCIISFWPPIRLMQEGEAEYPPQFRPVELLVCLYYLSYILFSSATVEFTPLCPRFPLLFIVLAPCW